ncbi:hypothetical protein NDU88_007549 [Pleurodeles waltl]|uniref:Uncharacterized protein n=1 Tax=Pleurodeles waltl TaxID=8319 RepID=A0AAV7RPS2_PLEWA|nr:hypothetical protein NDU88_007549 [Pleurodeles waltl]
MEAVQLSSSGPACNLSCRSECCPCPNMAPKPAESDRGTELLRNGGQQPSEAVGDGGKEAVSCEVAAAQNSGCAGSNGIEMSADHRQRS